MGQANQLVASCSIGRIRVPLFVSVLVLVSCFMPEAFAAKATSMVVVSSPQTLVLGACSAPVSVQAQDDAGLPSNVRSNTRIYFTGSDSGLKFYNDSNCSKSVTSVVMSRGTNIKKIYFRGNSLGALKLIVATYNYHDDQQIENIVTATGPGPTPAPTPVPTPGPTPTLPTTGRVVPSPIYGVTIDDISNISAQIAAIKTLPKVMTARVVLDPGTTPAYYAPALNSLKNTSYIMAELQDSADMKSQTIESFQARARTYYSGLKDSVDIWEVGNEINGDWLGSGVEDKLRAGFKVIDDAGATTAITFFWFGEKGEANNCIPAGRYEMFTWIRNLLQLDLPVEQRNPENEKMRLSLDYAFVSWYPQQCNNIKPDWPSVYARLGEIFPNAKIGFGEIGTANPQNGSTYEVNLINEFYPMANRVTMPPRYVGGYFWWYFSEEYNNQTIMNALKNNLLLGP